MPSTYAHYRFGEEVRRGLNGSAKETVSAYPELFLIGLHGPDIFFYYKPLWKSEVNRAGHIMHEWSGEKFFALAKEAVEKAKNREAAKAYLYGVICHFTLDAFCHGYVEEVIQETGISQVGLEVEFDRRLMIKDGLNPIRHRLTDHIEATPENAAVIADFYAFYGGISKEDVLKALQDINFYSDLLLAPDPVKRYVILALMRVTGIYQSLHGFIVGYRANPACRESNRRLHQLYKQALALAPKLITECEEGFTADTKDTSDNKSFRHPIYQRSFSPKEN